ncbi:MAG: hypothetical protein JWN70_2460 [Planctomycetaceae bacterium]|nr:hypothetical protein [Planctomycetaceae bacterium]
MKYLCQLAAASLISWSSFVVAADPTAAKPAAAKLIAHWKLAGDALDSSANGLHATNHGVVFEADKAGPLPGNARFGGSGQFLSVPHSDLLNLGADDFTISLWIHTDQMLDDDIGDLISKYDPATRTGFQLGVRNNTGVTSSSPNERQLEFGVDNGSEPQWADMGRPGGEQSVLPFSLAAMGTRLFAGTCEPGLGKKGDVYFYNHSKDGSKWDPIAIPHLANSVSSLVVYDGQLYAGTAKYRLGGSALVESENPNLGGQVFRLKRDESGWVSCGRLPNTEGIGGMTVYKGKLYASSLYKPAGFFRYDGAEKWTSLPTPNDKRTESLGVYNGYLWATGYDQGNIYRFDGETWADMGRLGDNTQTYSFAIHEGRLCVGTWPSGKVFRLVDKDQWEDMGRLGQELEVMGMLVHNGKLYAGTLPLAEVYRYDGGQTWTRIKQLDTTENVKYRRVWTMAQHAGSLVCGMLPSGHVQAMQTGRCTMSRTPLEAGWHHIAAVKQGLRLHIYRDGFPIADSSMVADKEFNISNQKMLRIGAGAGDTFNGRLSDVRIYRGVLPEADLKRMAGERKARLPAMQIIAHRGASARFPENTLISFSEAKDVGATCIEIDVRRTKDGILVPFHDETVDRTSNGKGRVNDLTYDDIRKLDLGTWKDHKFSEEHLFTVDELLSQFKVRNYPVEGRPAKKFDVLLDIKEEGDEFAKQVASTVTENTDPAHVIIGVRTVEQAKLFRKLLPQSRQLGLIATPQEIEAFAAAGVETIRLWPKWLTDETLVPRVRKAKAKLHLNGTTGLPDDIIPLLKYQPDSLSTDDPEQLIETLLGH